MYYKNTEIHYSPSDLITFLESPFASHMERSLLEDKSMSKYLDPEDKMLLNLQQKGQEHEKNLFQSLFQTEKSFKNTR